GLWVESIPKQVNLLKPPENIKYMLIPRKELFTSIIELIRNFKFSILLQLLFYSLYGIKTKNMNIARQHWWKKSNKNVAKLNKQYDVAVAYMNLLPTYFIVDKVKAEKKICWMHKIGRASCRERV